MAARLASRVQKATRPNSAFQESTELALDAARKTVAVVAARLFEEAFKVLVNDAIESGLFGTSALVAWRGDVRKAWFLASDC